MPVAPGLSKLYQPKRGGTADRVAPFVPILDGRFLFNAFVYQEDGKRISSGFSYEFSIKANSDKNNNDQKGVTHERSDTFYTKRK